jgi:hypothetical protein
MNLLNHLGTRAGSVIASGASLLSDLMRLDDRDYASARDLSAMEDLDDFLIRQQFRHWAGQQHAPQPGKFRLLQAVLQGNEFEDGTETPAHKKHHTLPPTYWGQEARAGYIAFTFQYMHIRVVA